MKITSQDIGSYLSSSKSDKVIYLSADSENVLETVDMDSTYIIGGIVDRNRHKVSIGFFEVFNIQNRAHLLLKPLI